MKYQHATSASGSNYLKLIFEACERSTRRAKVTRMCEESSTTPLKDISLTPLTRRDDLKNC